MAKMRCEACEAKTSNDIASGLPAPMVLESRPPVVKATLCTPCARLMLTQLEQTEHGDYVTMWKVAS